jgi:hypothetical protein
MRLSTTTRNGKHSPTALLPITKPASTDHSDRSLALGADAVMEMAAYLGRKGVPVDASRARGPPFAFPSTEPGPHTGKRRRPRLLDCQLLIRQEGLAPSARCRAALTGMHRDICEDNS